MAYIGRDTDKISNVEVLDNITFDGSSSYTLQKGGSNFTPSSANTLLVSINGVVQAGNFTVSGSTIDFGTAVAGTSTCDFILHYGVGLITAPADGTVTTAKIGSNAVTTAKIADANVTSAKMFSGFANGITMADQWRLSATYSYSNNQADIDLTSNWERVDTDGFGQIGTGMTESSGIFTFPSTGIYLITFTFFADNTAATGNNRFVGGNISTTLDNSSYSGASQVYSNIPAAAMSKDAFTNGSMFHMFDVTDVTTHKVKFRVTANLNSTNFQGNTSLTSTSASFTRLGDT